MSGAGTGYVEGFDADADAVTVTVTSATEQLSDLQLVYSAPNGGKYTRIVLNGEGGSQVELPETTEWKTVSAGQVLLKAGSNTISIQNHWGW